uniref:Uncharacterized protein n=1 Tax=Xiphophorus couchianus TaxID=32473 RepID=A0A3B5LY55_9TELE
MELQTAAEHKQVNQALGFHWLSFAYQGLTEIPYDSILMQTDTLKVLDLSYNILDEYPFLLICSLTLILDSNNYTSHVKFPYMPSITAMCINKNKINNLPVFVEEIWRKFPNIKVLSMMNNEAAPSYFNGGSLSQYIDYRWVFLFCGSNVNLNYKRHTAVFAQKRQFQGPLTDRRPSTK